jgi:hypothetical protein
LRTRKAFVPISIFGRLVGHALLLLLLASAASAQTAPPSLRQPGPTLPADGTYLAGDYRFAINRFGDYERFRFSGDDEMYYLTIDPAPMGGRVLKYDSGEIVLQVAGWGGVTLYTKRNPNGLPAERAGDTTGLEPAPLVPANQVKTFALRISDEIQQRTGLLIGFRANWEELANSDPMRALACDAIRNAARAIEWVASSHKAGQVLITQFNVVRITPTKVPTVSIGENLLTIGFASSLGEAGRPSSLAIIRVLR